MERAVIVTTINRPSPALKMIARDCPDWSLIVVGDRKTPSDWSLDGAFYLSIRDQEGSGGEFARQSPLDHYCRKNVGYLHAMREGAQVIAETDDDNLPYRSFLRDVGRMVSGRRVIGEGWRNVYRHFTEARIWPRGFPLELITASLTERLALGPLAHFDCPVQQFLADGDPDVDAIYRLTTEGEVVFDANANAVVLGPGAFCPFNSQNTIWWPEAFPLLYLPNFVSFRMTDIWRSFVAQVCLYAIDKHLAFRAATVRQERNAHSLLRDFEQEVPGYLHNERILGVLQGLTLSGGSDDTGGNLWLCYKALISEGLVPVEELRLVELWLDELSELSR